LTRRYAILEAPSALGHVPEHLGVERAPEVLLEAGLAGGLNARRAGRVPAEGYSSVLDPLFKVMNPQPLRDNSIALADEVGALIGGGEFPVVLGGDCSLLLGSMLALRRRGRYGVLYVDGDADFTSPRSTRCAAPRRRATWPSRPGAAPALCVIWRDGGR
jgi:arginase